MQVSHAIRERRSTRAFLPDSVPPDAVLQILDLARWSPSWANSQDWNVYVVAGDALEELREDYELLTAEDAPAETDLTPQSGIWPEHLAERITMSAPTSEAPGVMEDLHPSAFYGAPCLVLFAVDEELDPTYAAFDAGLLVQSFCLAAEDRGYATCIMARAVRFADVLHELIPEAEGKRFLVGVAFGQADHTAVINRGERIRADVSEIATVITDMD